MRSVCMQIILVRANGMKQANYSFIFVWLITCANAELLSFSDPCLLVECILQRLHHIHQRTDNIHTAIMST